MLREFCQKHPDAQEALEAWYHDVKHSQWKTPTDIKKIYRSCSFAGKNRVIFNIKGNKYWIVAAIQYAFGIVYIRFVGTHGDYDKIDATTM